MLTLFYKINLIWKRERERERERGEEEIGQVEGSHLSHLHGSSSLLLVLLCLGLLDGGVSLS